MNPTEIRSFDDLERYLRNFTTWDGDHVHDFTGTVVLLGALLDNLRINALEVDLEIIGGYLSDEQKTFLRQVAEWSKNPVED